MIYRTYTCSTDEGTIEYGFTFKIDEECEDCLFDMIIGSAFPHQAGEIQARLDEHEWAAKAVVAASPT